VHSVSSSLAAASAETAPLGTPRAERRNRSHTLAAVR